MTSEPIHIQSTDATRRSYVLLVLVSCSVFLLSGTCSPVDARRAMGRVASLQTLDQLRTELRMSRSSLSETNKLLADALASRKRLLSSSRKIRSSDEVSERKEMCARLRNQECFYRAAAKSAAVQIAKLESKIQSECDSISIPRSDLALRYPGTTLALGSRQPLCARTASTSGKVLYSGWLGGYGRSVVVRNSDEICTLFVQLNKIQVHEGQDIAKDQIIGYETFERIGIGRSTCVVRVPNDMSEKSEVLLERVSKLAITDGEWK